jgi:uncharacterized membrane protein
MSNNTHLIVYTFAGEGRAEEARDSLRALAGRLDTVRLGNIAIIARHADGRLDFWESAEAEQIQRDAGIGSLAGWLLGAIGAVLGAPLGPRQGLDAGAGVGGEVAERVDLGFQDDDLRRFGEQLVAGSSALLALVRPEDAATVIGELEALGGTLTQSSLPPETVARLGVLQ